MGKLKVRRRGILCVVGAVAIPAALMVPLAPVQASHGGNVHCGVSVTASVSLNADVGPCLGHGIIAGADNITIDLNGFAVLGDPGNANTGADEAGIYLNGRTGVVVTDSTAPDPTTGKRSNRVTGFDAGVGIVAGSANTIENLNIVANVGTDGPLMGEGVHVNGSDGNTIRANWISENGPYAGVTLLGDSDGNTLGGSAAGDGNVIENNNAANQDIGVRLESGTTGTTAEPDSCTDGNTVAGNRISGSSIDGISILNGSKCDSTGNTISHNAIYANGRDGVRLNARCFNDPAATPSAPCPTATAPNNTVPHGALDNAVEHNSVCGNAGAGIRATFASTGNTITNNQAGDGATMHHGPSVPCTPNNVVTAASPVGSPLLPPHGDLNDGNGNCLYNTWSANTYTTKNPSCIA